MDENYHNRIAKLSIAKNSHNTRNLISFDKTKILTFFPFHTTWVIREPLKIKKHTNKFNEDDFYMLDNWWYMGGCVSVWIDVK